MSGVADLAAIQRRASVLEAEAEAATRAYNRGTWFRYAVFFIPIPLAVLMLRWQLDAWGWILAGALFLAVAAAMVALDGAAAARRDRAIAAAERARLACDEAPAS